MSTKRRIRRLLAKGGEEKAVVFVPDFDTAYVIKKILTEHGNGINTFVVTSQPIFEKVLETVKADYVREEESEVLDG